LIAFAATRMLQAIPLVFGASIIVFVMMRLIPGDPAEVYAGPQASPEIIQNVRRDFGLDKPLPAQYAVWISKAVKGDLGDSYLSHAPVRDLLAQRIPATLELTLAAMLIALLIGLPVGVLSAIRADTPVDWLATSGAAVAIAIPSYWSGILAIYVFAQVLGWLPPGGRVEFTKDPLEASRYLLLPALTLGAYTSATMARLTKSTMLEVLHEDFVRTARSKGLAESQVILKHVLRNALVPIVTVMGLQFGRLLGGAVITETIFAWPGVGRLILFAVGNRDYAIVQGALLLLIVSFVVVNMIVDITYGMLDPRIRVGRQASVS
jgi:ABC-type dipeptide/oligopeptide/nickel transport system permease component